MGKNGKLKITQLLGSRSPSDLVLEIPVTAQYVLATLGLTVMTLDTRTDNKNNNNKRT
jgi:hypothetical protein